METLKKLILLLSGLSFFLILLPVPIKAKWFVLIYGGVELLFGVTGSMPPASAKSLSTAENIIPLSNPMKTGTYALPPKDYLRFCKKMAMGVNIQQQN